MIGELRDINVYLVVYFVVNVYLIGALRVGHEAERRRLASEIEAERERSQARYQLLLSNFYFTLLNTLLTSFSCTLFRSQAHFDESLGLSSFYSYALLCTVMPYPPQAHFDESLAQRQVRHNCRK